jgi:hypothetical protein
MKKLIALLLFALPLMAQQPQTQTATAQRMNVLYVNGVAPGYWPQAGAGLVLNIGKGTANCANTIVEYAGGTLTLANNTLNYVYLDTTSSCAPGSNTTGFTSATIPIAKVTTLSSVITTIDDVRSPFTTVAASGVSGSGTNPKIAIWASGGAVGNIGTPTLCSGGTPAAAGIDANGNATGCQSISAGSSGGPNPSSRRWTLLTTSSGAIGGATSGYNVGNQAASQNLCNSGWNTPNTSTPNYQNPYTLCTTATSGTQLGINGQQTFQNGNNDLYVTKASITQISSIRFRVGAADTSYLTAIGSDSLTGNNSATFRFSTSAGDTHFMCQTTDGSSVTTTDSGITPVASAQYKFQIQFNDSVPNVVFSINGSAVCTNTTHLPTSGTVFRTLVAAEPLSNTSTIMTVAWMYEEGDN